MSLLRTIFLICLISTSAQAGLYGINTANPWGLNERVLKLFPLPEHIVNYRDEMRQNVIMLSNYGKQNNPDFQIIVHEGEELLSIGKWENDVIGYNFAKQGQPDETFMKKNFKSSSFAQNYLQKIDGVVRNKNFFTNDNKVLLNDTTKHIKKFSDIENHLFVLDDSKYADKQEMLRDLENNNYDILVITPLFRGHNRLSKEEVKGLGFKKNGSKRLVVAEMNISEIRKNSYNYNHKWKIGKPAWLKRASFVDEDGIIAQYWNEQWRRIISNHFKSIVKSGYDGAFLTGLDNHKYFETQTPLE